MQGSLEASPRAALAAAQVRGVRKSRDAGGGCSVHASTSGMAGAPAAAAAGRSPAAAATAFAAAAAAPVCHHHHHAPSKSCKSAFTARTAGTSAHGCLEHTPANPSSQQQQQQQHDARLPAAGPVAAAQPAPEAVQQLPAGAAAGVHWLAAAPAPRRAYSLDHQCYVGRATHRLVFGEARACASTSALSSVSTSGLACAAVGALFPPSRAFEDLSAANTTTTAAAAATWDMGSTVGGWSTACRSVGRGACTTARVGGGRPFGGSCLGGDCSNGWRARHAGCVCTQVRPLASFF